MPSEPISNLQSPISAQSNRSLLRLLTTCALIAITASCTVTPQTEAPALDARELRAWQASGRLAVSGDSGGGSGSFTWRQEGDDAEVHIRGPLGVGSLRLALKLQELRIQTGDGQSLEAAEAQAELESRLGATVPTASLRYWFIGLPAPGAHEVVAGPESTVLQQDEWRIDFQRFAITNGVRLPMRWTAVNGPAKVRVIVDKWQIR